MNPEVRLRNLSMELLASADRQWAESIPDSDLIEWYEKYCAYLAKYLLAGHSMPRTKRAVEIIRAEIVARGLEVPES